MKKEKLSIFIKVVTFLLDLLTMIKSFFSKSNKQNEQEKEV